MISIEVLFGTINEAKFLKVLSDTYGVQAEVGSSKRITFYLQEDVAVQLVPMLMSAMSDSEIVKEFTVKTVPNIDAFNKLLRDLKLGKKIPGVAVHRSTFERVSLENAIEQAGGKVIRST